MAEATTSPDSPTTPPSGRGGLKVLGLVVLILLLAGGFVLYRQRHTVDRLRLAVEELDRTDPGWRMEEIEASRREVPDTENGALIVGEVARRLPKGWPPAALDTLDRVPPPAQYSAEAFARLEAELMPLEPALDAARHLAWFPYGRFPVVYAQIPIGTCMFHLEEVSRTTRLLALDARRHAQAGNLKEAMQSCRAALNGARSVGDEPLLGSQLSRISSAAVACQAIEYALSQGEPDPKDLGELQGLLELEDGHQGLMLGLRGDRAMLHRSFEAIENGEVSWADLARGFNVRQSWKDEYLPQLAVQRIFAEHPRYLSLLNRQIEVAALPLHQQSTAARAFDADVKAFPRDIWLLRLAEPAGSAAFDASVRHHANVRCLLVLLAAERYRRAQGRWPKALEDLTPQFLASVPEDPFDGKPLRYRILPDGVVVYSVGLDGADDGGHIDREHPTAKGTDFGYRLWDIKHRHQPPRPSPAPTGGLRK